MFPWWVQETSSKNVIDPKLWNGSVKACLYRNEKKEEEEKNSVCLKQERYLLLG